MDGAKHETHIHGPVHGFVQGENNVINFTFQSSNKEQQSFSQIWNVPHRRNPFFSGRETLLTHLYDLLHKNKAAALTQTQTISGLGGIGKTQIAIEYAYRYRDEYHSVFWVRATSLELLVSDFVAVATLLELPVKDEQDQNVVVAAVKQWLEHHEKWLLILDNVDDLIQISDFFPTGGSGHILITTRNQASGSIAHNIEVEKMDKQEGTLLLLRRSKVLIPEASLDQVP